MSCERSKFPILYKCWKKQTGFGLDVFGRAYDPVREINSHLLPNDHHEARLRGKIIACVGRVVVVNPGQFQAIRKSVNKTGKNDARALAFYLSKDMPPETHLKSKAHSESASLTQTRDLLLRQRTRLINKIHALFNRHGIKLKKETFTSKRALEHLDMSVFSAIKRIEMGIIRDQALSLTQAIKSADERIEQCAASLEDYDGLTSVKGTGSRAAAVFLSAIGDVNDFENQDRLAAYFGTVLQISQSSETGHYGRIIRRGNKLVRTALAQCRFIAIRCSGYPNSYYQRIRERKGAGKAIITTARKLLKIIYSTLKNKWIFKDFTTFSLAENQINAGQSS